LFLTGEFQRLPAPSSPITRPLLHLACRVLLFLCRYLSGLFEGVTYLFPVASHPIRLPTVSIATPPESIVEVEAFGWNDARGFLLRNLVKLAAAFRVSSRGHVDIKGDAEISS